MLVFIANETHEGLVTKGVPYELDYIVHLEQQNLTEGLTITGSVVTMTYDQYTRAVETAVEKM